MEFKIGETINIKDTELLILDIINGNPFVVALGVDVETKFSHNSNNYVGSVLEEKVNDWIKTLNVPVIPREVDLTTMDGSKLYGSITADAAPLTFDEYRKYAETLIPHIEHWFWLATAWSDPKWDNWGATNVCYVITDGGASYGNYYYTGGALAPAFVLDKSFFDKPNPDMLSHFSIEELLAEVTKRVKEGV